MSRRCAFTLVELLVVVAIIGVLVALLLPAVQAAREAARKTQCANHVKQLALASLNHETAHGHFPTGGWGFKWVGDPDAGYGEEQPGGWAYNILAYLEQPALRQLGAGQHPFGKEAQLLRVVTTPVAVFHCPSKRPVQGYPLDTTSARATLAGNCTMCRVEDDCYVARGDYRANAGNIGAGDTAGPLPDEDWAKYWHALKMAGGLDFPSGASFRRSTVRMGQITDGASKTYLLGEKVLSPANYFDGNYTADDQCVYSGHDNDNVGYTGNGSNEFYTPVRDWPARNADTKFRFGGPHVDGFYMGLCDGSVHFTGFEIQELTFWRLGGRNDGED